MKRWIFLILTLLLLSPALAKADLICKGKRIKGFSSFDVLRYCGEPLAKDSYLTHGYQARGHKKIQWTEVKQWFYTSGYQKTSYTVEFEKGYVVRVIKGQKAP